MKNVSILFCDVDYFCQIFMPILTKPLLSEDKPRRNRRFLMSAAEVMTILILFHRSNYRNLKSFYTEYVPFIYGKSFPNRVSYNRRVPSHKTFKDTALQLIVYNCEKLIAFL